MMSRRVFSKTGAGHPVPFEAARTLPKLAPSQAHARTGLTGDALPEGAPERRDVRRASRLRA